MRMNNCKHITIFLIAVLLLLSVATSGAAQEIKEPCHDSRQNIELRVAAAYSKTFHNRLSLGIEEEIRSGMYDSLTHVSGGNYGKNEPVATPYFHKSYTTVSLSYEPIDYLSLGAAYTLKLYGNKGWDDANEFIRHRMSAYVMGQYKTGQWKFSLRERLVADLRTDSVNKLEQPQCALELRHRLHVDYSVVGKPLKAYANFELINTLNQPTQYLNQLKKASDKRYGQYLSSIRAGLGLKWRINANNTLNFYYRLDTNYDRDLNITRIHTNGSGKQVGGHAELTYLTEYQHIFGVAYEFGH